MYRIFGRHPTAKMTTSGFKLGLFQLQVVVPAEFLDIFAFPSPVLQRGEAWENAKIAGRPTFAPKNLWNKWSFELAEHMYRIRTLLGFGTSKAQLKKSKHNMCLVGGTSRAKKRRRRTKFCSQQRPIGGRVRTKNTTINQTNVSINTLGAYLCDCGSIGLLWLSWYRFSSAAPFRAVQQRLIVMICAFSYNNRQMKLKLSHE